MASQNSSYLERQTAAFAQGSRHNDINEQMRSVAAALTDAERASVAQYYARAPANSESILPAESAYAAAEASAADTGGLAPMMSSQNMKTISPTTAGRVYR